MIIIWSLNIKLKLCNVKQQSQHRKQFDVVRLKCPNTNKDFALEMMNHLSALADRADEIPIHHDQTGQH